MATKPINDSPALLSEQPTEYLSNYLDEGFDLELFYNQGNVNRELACQILKQNLESLNPDKIHITVTALEWTTYLQYRREGTTPIVFLGWLPDYADPDDYLNPLYHSYGSFANLIGYSNATLDAMIEAAAAENDPNLRAEAYEQISWDMYNESAYIWTDQPTSFHAERDWLSGYLYNPMFCGLNYYTYDKPDIKPADAPDTYDPDTFVMANYGGDPWSLDPIVNYDTVGGEIIQNVYETLVFYNGSSASELVPLLATEVPSIDNGGISLDGMTYTYHLRNDVTFQDGTPMTSSDVKYSLTRALLLNDHNGPAWMIGQVTIPNYYDFGMGYFDGETFYPAEDLYGYSIANEIDDAFWCVDDYTIQINLTRPYAAFNQIMAFQVASVISEDFVEANGGLTQSGFNYLFDHMCGSGPYQLVDWAYSNYISLTSNSYYWRTAPAIPNVMIQQVWDEGARILALQNGEVDSAIISKINKAAVEGYPGIAVMQGMDTFNLNFIGLNQNINLAGLANPELTNVPADFFADRNVRLAFAHAFDYSMYIENASNGMAIQPNGAIPKGMFGYSADIPVYELNLTKTAEYLRNATFEVPDTNPPEVTITSPISNTVFNVTSVTVEWVGHDNESNVTFQVNLDGQLIAYNLTDLSWTFNDLSEGWHWIAVFARDESWNFGQANVFVIIDLSGPDVQITNPPDGSFVRTSSITVEWIADDEYSEVDHCLVYLDQQLEAEVNGTSWTLNGLSEGVHEVKVVAYDVFDQSGENSSTFTVDTVDPVISITAPTEGEQFDTNGMNVNWTASDVGSGIDRFVLHVDGGNGIDLTEEGYQLTGMADGPHTVTIDAYDLAGNVATDSVSFSVDTGGPVLSIDSPQPGEQFGSDSVSVNWTAEDLGSGLKSCSVWLDGTPVAQDLTNGTWTFHGLSDGEHEVKVIAIDELDKETNASVTFFVDTIPPTVQITSPTDDVAVDTSTVAVIWTGADEGSGVDSYTLYLDDVKIAQGLTNTTWTFHGLSEGEHLVRVVAYDDVSNIAEDSASFLVDLGPPMLSLTAPEDDDMFGSGTVTVTWTATDAGAGVSNYSLWLDQTLVAQGLTNTTWTFHGLIDGEHKVKVAAYDELGKAANTTVDFLVDTVGPTVVISSPDHAATFNVTTVVVTWSATDLGSGVSNYTLILDEVVIAEGLTNTTWTFNGMSEAPHGVKVIAYDQISNSGNDTAGFWIEVVDLVEVRIRLVDQNGSPIANAEVVVDGDLVGLTDDDGWITFTIYEGSHTVSAEIDGESTEWNIEVTPENDEFSKTMELDDDGGVDMMLIIAIAAVVGIVAIAGAVLFLRRKP